MAKIIEVKNANDQPFLLNLDIVQTIQKGPGKSQCFAQFIKGALDGEIINEDYEELKARIFELLR